MDDRILGGIYGVAVGDALGATLEFMSQEEVREKYVKLTEIIGEGWLNIEKGAVTDDTEMTLAVGSGILQNPEDPMNDVGDQFVKWYQSNPVSIGQTVKQSIENYIKIKDWKAASELTNQQLKGRTAGNGSLMRTLPVSFIYLNNFEKMDEVSAKISDLTHYAIEARYACMFYNRLAAYLYQGNQKNEAFSQAIADMEEKLNQIKQLEQLKSIDSIEIKDLKPTGYVMDTLITALVMFLRYDNFEDILVEAVNLGGDADTIGAVAGGLAGVFYGYDSIPERWIMALKNREMLDKISQRIEKQRSVT